ncbi:hypothetical protein BDIM_14780 [Brevundimonas diminuta ATCC 11568]|nr:hypothetical protein BDIM_14780 [Brevundimonas diminuta ATCC 11568]
MHGVPASDREVAPAHQIGKREVGHRRERPVKDSGDVREGVVYASSPASAF